MSRKDRIIKVLKNKPHGMKLHDIVHEIFGNDPKKSWSNYKNNFWRNTFAVME